MQALQTESCCFFTVQRREEMKTIRRLYYSNASIGPEEDMILFYATDANLWQTA
jgi:hypothetical protein